MKSYNIVGLDFSLTSPGVSCLTVFEDGTYKFIDFDSCKTSSDEEWFVRLKRIQTMVLQFIWKHKPRSVMVENYSFGSINGREIAGEVHGIILFKLIEQGFPPERIHRIVSPQGRAKFFTGSGKAKKKEVVKAFNEAFGFNFKVKENDIVDASVLAYIGYCMNHYELVEPTLEKYQKEVMEKVLLKTNTLLGGK